MTAASHATRAQHWAQINEFSLVFGMRLLFWLRRNLGHWPFRIALYPVVLWYIVAKPAARAASRDYLSRLASSGNAARLKPGRITVFRHFAMFAESILDKMLLWSGFCSDAPIEYRGRELIAAQIAGGRGALLICCHMGNPDLCRVMAKEMAGLKITVLTHTKHAERFNRLLAQLNPQSQLDIVQVTDLSAASAVLLAEKVDRGEFIAVVGDRIPVSPRPRVAFAQFLGQPAPFPVGPYILASLFQCPVYLLFSLRSGRGSEIHFEPFRESIRLPRKGRDTALAELVGEYARRLEHYCRRAPLQWFNFYNFWQLPGVDATDVSK
jgi:predicted LPLAT superfamily acyltransferase